MTLAAQLSRACGGLALVAAATGCGCVTTDAARAIDEQLVLRNRANAEQAMKAAARRSGAVLLPIEAEEFEMSPLCGLNGDPCLEEVEANASFSRVRNAQGQARLAIWVPVELRRYARLAKGSNRLFLLTPKLSHRVIDEKTRCECDGMFNAVGRIEAAFLVDDMPGVEIITLNVPMTVDRYKWKCKVVLR